MLWALLIGIFGGALSVTAVRLFAAYLAGQEKSEADDFEIFEEL